MKQLIYDEKFNEGERFSGETEFLIVESDEGSRMIADNHSSPESLIYFGEEFVETLELIRYANFSTGMKKVIERKYKVSFDEVIDFLKDHRLILYQGRNWMDNFKSDFYILSMRGLELLARYDLVRSEKEE